MNKKLHILDKKTPYARLKRYKMHPKIDQPGGCKITDKKLCLLFDIRMCIGCYLVVE